MKKQDVENILPLTPIQEGILFHAIQNPGNDVYYEQYNCTLKGNLKIDEFKNAWQSVVDRHSVLRTQFLWEGKNNPLQVIRKKAGLNFHFHDFSGYTVNEQQAQVESLIKQDERIGFDLKSPSLLRIHLAKLSETEYFLIWSFHHIIMDGWCLGVVLNEVSSIYNAFSSDKTITLPKAKQYREYIAWLKNQKLEKSENFWLHSLDGFINATQLCIDKKTEATLHDELSIHEINIPISNQLTDKIIEFSKEHKITQNAIFQSAWSLMLHFYSNSKDVLHGTTLSTRPVEIEGSESILGLFINTIPVRTVIDHNKNIKEWLIDQHNLFKAKMPHLNVPLQQILAVSELTSNQALFDTLLVFENYPFSELIKKAFEDIEIENLQYVEKANFPLTIVIVPGEKYLLRALYDRNRFNDIDIEKLLERMSVALEQLVVNADRNLSDVYFMDEEEQENYLTRYTDKSRIEELVVMHPSIDARLVDNQPVYILNANLKPLPENHPGKLYIGIQSDNVDSDNNLFNPYSSEYNKLLDTGLIAQWNGNGEFTVVLKDNGMAIVEGKQVKMSKIETALLAEDGIENCAVCSFGEPNKPDIIIAYIVTNKELEVKELKEKLIQTLSEKEIPSDFVTVSSIPYDGEGNVDYKKLSSVELIGEKVTSDWKTAIEETDGINEAVAYAGKQISQQEVLHISDLIDDWKETGSNNKTVSAEEEEKQEEQPFIEVINPSVCAGDKLDESVLPNILSEIIMRAAKDESGKGVTYIDEKGNEEFQSYAEILVAAKKVLTGFRNSGVKPKDKIIFQLKNNKDFVIAFWACQLGGFIPVPLGVAPSYKQANNDVKKLSNAWVMLEKPWVISDSQLKPELDALNNLFEDWGAETLEIDSLINNQEATEIHPCDKNDVAVLLLTSGSTGMPKGVMQPHVNLIRRSVGTSIFNKHHKDDVSFNWMPLDHVGGIVMFTLRDTLNICHHMVAPTNYILEEPLRWLDIMSKHKVSVTWAPNFAFGLVNDRFKTLKEEEGANWNLSKLRFILNAGEAIVAKTARLFMSNLLKYKIQPTAMKPCWGMSETCSGVTYNHNFLLDTTSDDDPYVIVGEPIPGFEIRITDNKGNPVEEGETGNLEVKGTTVTIGYFNNDKVNEESYTDDGWFKTGDLGILKNRNLVIAGRKKDEIIINGINYNNAEIELVVDEIEEVETSFSAVCSFRENNNDTDKVALFFCPKNNAVETLGLLISKVKERVIQNIGINLDVIIPVEKGKIPKTGIGKIQRAKLKNQLLAGEFDSEVKSVDILSGNDKTIPDWFFQKKWTEKESLSATNIAEDSIVILFDNSGKRTSALQNQLDKQCKTIVTVGAENSYKKSSEFSFEINPAEKDDYINLLDEIRTSYPLDKLVFIHLWTTDEVEGKNINLADLKNTQNKGVLSLMFLTQALEKYATDNIYYELFVVSKFAQLIGLQEASNFVHSTLFGFIKTAKHEISWLKIRHIDLDSPSYLTQAIQVKNELCSIETSQEVAYRNGKRFILSLQPVNIKDKINPAETLKKEMLYLVTGGLGGLGTELILMLAKKYQMRFLIVGKTELPSQESWKDYENDDSVVAKRIKSAQVLKDTGVEFEYHNLVISKHEDLAEIVASVESKWNTQLAGIFHLAGEGNLEYHWKVMEKHQVVNETVETFHKMFEPKVYGTLALFKLIENKPNVPFILFSSVNGLFGGSTFSAYSSANSFQDTFSEFLHKSGYPVHCFSWSMWDDVGMSENNPDFANEASKGMGYSIIHKQKGFNSLLAGLNNYQGHLIVGLDAANKNISKLITGEQLLATKKLAAFYTGEEISADNYTIYDKLNNEVSAELINVDEIPRDTENNIDFEQLEAIRQQTFGKSKEKIAPSTPTEKKLAVIWRDVLEVSEVSSGDNFFELGGHSLKATQVISRIKKEFEIDLPLTQLFQNATIMELSKEIDRSLGIDEETDDSYEIKKIGNKENIPLSYAQQRLWFLKQYEPESSFYNIPEAVRFYGKLDTGVMQQCIDEIIRRHESLRTVFQYVDGQVVQIIKPFESLPFEQMDLSHLSKDERERKVIELATVEAGKNFFIDKGPLVRITIVKMDTDYHVVFLTMHHIISDGWSFGVFVRELMELFAAFTHNKPSPLPELNIQYSDFSIWQREWFEGKIKEEQLKYWKNKIGDNLSTLELPTDKPRPLKETYNGKRYYFTISKKDAVKVETLCKQTGATVYMVLLAAFKTLLSRYSGQNDIVVGSPVANRNHRDIENLIGFFVNSLVMRTDLSDSPSFLEIVERVKRTALEAYSNQDIPFEMLVDELEVKRDLSRNPLFQVMFALQNQTIPELEMENLSIKRIEIDNHSSMFDMWLSMSESPDGFEAICEYNTDLWEEATIRRMMGHFKTLIKNVCIDPNQSISEIELFTESEKLQLLNSFNNTQADYPKEKTIIDMFEEQVAKTPENTAVICGDTKLSYKELKDISDKIAAYLQKAWNIEAGDLIGLMIEREEYLIPSIFGILKAGAAYVPIDPKYPAERINSIIEDSKLKVLITREKYKNSAINMANGIIDLDKALIDINKIHLKDLNVKLCSNNLAYVIYTSGSTGKPKGVMIEHHSVINRLEWMQNAYPIEQEDVLIQKTPIVFDVSVWELFWWSFNGASLCILKPEGEKDPGEITAAIEKHKVTTIHFVPSMLNVFLSVFDNNSNYNALSSLRQVFSSGEALMPKQVNLFGKLLNKNCGTRLINLYGPTEATVDVSYYECDFQEECKTVPIGKPIENIQLYVLDKKMQLVPIGVNGELHIAGVGLARGYLHNDQLTKEKFVKNPFDSNGKIYKTGDLAKWLPDGNIEFIGRIDDQVKIRGFRIELGEIESAIATHQKVSNTAVIVQQGDNHENQLVAYVVKKDDKLIENNEEYNNEQVSQWETVFDSAYVEPEKKIEDETFNVLSWYSSYTGKLIPEPEMREWLDDTIQNILDFNPKDVLEIGCGNGLILFRVAPHCQTYVGTDIAQNGIDYINSYIDDDLKSKISLFRRDGNDFSGFEGKQFDTIVINSVIQYFPNIEYLNEVIQKALGVLKPNGRIFIGDIRSLPLLETYHTSVELYKAEDYLKVDELKKRIHNGIEQENELLINPGYFYATKTKFPQINKIRIFPRKGKHHNELTKFRYQAVIQVGDNLPNQPIEWWDWHQKQLTIPLLSNLLKSSTQGCIGISNIPNARLAKEEQVRFLMEQREIPKTIGMLKELMKNIVMKGVDPENFYKLVENIGFHVEFDWSRHRQFGEFDVILINKKIHPDGSQFFKDHNFIDDIHSGAALSDYANNPLQWKFNSEFVPGLKKYIGEKLPEYMVPSFFVLMNELPLTPNGKLNRKVLPAPENNRKYLETIYQAPANQTEQIIAEIWQEILHIDKVGANDNFFDLGGHSLFMVSVHSKLKELFETNISVVELFQYPTISALAGYLNTGEQASVTTKVFERAESRKEAMKKKQGLRKQKLKR